MTKINFEQTPNINIDCVIGFGDGCRIAGNLKKNNLRFFSTPFDWQMNYSLENVYSLLENEGKNFFQNYKFNSKYNKGKKLGIVDTETGMISEHDYSKYLPKQINDIFFKYKYKRRFKRLHKILQDAQNICIVTLRSITTQEILSFIEKFSQLYTFKHLYFINIYDTENKESDEELIITNKDNVTILEYYFNDEHPNGNNKETNPDYWLGNIDYWNKILAKITLNKSFVKKHISYKMVIIKIYCMMHQLIALFHILVFFLTLI